MSSRLPWGARRACTDGARCFPLGSLSDARGFRNSEGCLRPLFSAPTGDWPCRGRVLCHTSSQQLPPLLLESVREGAASAASPGPRSLYQNSPEA